MDQAYKWKLNGRRGLCIAASFSSERRVYESDFARIEGLIDEISTKGIHIEEEIRGNFLSTVNARISAQLQISTPSLISAPSKA